MGNRRTLARSRAVKLDRISELHIDLKHLILEHLPVKEIARTSILSSQWRHVLLSHPNLIFDRKSYNNYRRKHEDYKQMKSSIDEFQKAIKRILSSHTGTINKFTLFIPGNKYEWYLPDCDLHVHDVTRLLPASITQLCIDNDGIGMFSVSAMDISRFQELTYLEIGKGSFDIDDSTVTSLPKLTQLNLDSIVISDKLVQTILRIAPRLKRLSIRSCLGENKLTIDLSSITEFVMDNCDVDVCSFSETCSLSSLTLSLRNNWSQSDVFHCILPNLKRLEILDFQTIELLSPCLDPETYSDDTPWALQKLILHRVSLNKKQNPHLIVLLKRAKNVEEMHITDNTGAYKGFTDILRKCIDKDITLDRLQTVSYVFPRRVDANVDLLRSILTCSPALVNLNIGYSKRSCPNPRQRVEMRISEFYRASRNVKVRYFPNRWNRS